jgi:hypothetical protein
MWISSQASDLRGQDQIKSSQNDAIDGLVKYYGDDGIPAEIVAFVCGNTSPLSSGLRKLVIRMAEYMFPYGRCRKAQGLFSYQVPP